MSILEWGLRHVTGTFSRVDINAVRQALLPFVDRARLTQAGIRVSAAGLKGLIYHPCSRELLDIISAGGEKTGLKVQYDPRLIDFVWATHHETRAFIRCSLSTPDYRGMSWAEGLQRRQQTEMKRPTGSSGTDDRTPTK